MGRKTKRTNKIAAFIMCVVLGTLSCMTVFASEVPVQEHSHIEEALCCTEEQAVGEQVVALMGEACWVCQYQYGGTFVEVRTHLDKLYKNKVCAHGKLTYDHHEENKFLYEYRCDRCGYVAHSYEYWTSTYLFCMP